MTAPADVLNGMEAMTEQPGTTSWTELAVTHAPALLRLARMLTGSRVDAEDLLQSTLLRAGRHSDRIAAMAAPAAYLRRVMVNEHISRTRRSRHRPREVPQDAAEAYVGDVLPHDAVEHRDEVWRWLATLSPRQRAVLVLRYYEELPDHEIATLLAVPEATVRSHAHRALAALRGRLTGEDTRS
jgi:RNA polymerase sigma-70 factor (sigma-E family)